LQSSHSQARQKNFLKKSERSIWLEAAHVDKLTTPARQRRESHSDVILRLVGLEGEAG